MPSSHHFLSDPYLYVARFRGKLTLSELLEGVETCRTSPHFQSEMPQLIDLSAVTDIDLSFDDLTRFLASLRHNYSQNSSGTEMIVLAGGDHFFAHARQFQLLAASLESLNVKVFTDTAECMSALGLSFISVQDLVDHASTPDHHDTLP